MADAFAREYQRISRLIHDADISRVEKKKAFDAILGIRKLLESDQLDVETATAMATKLATAVRFVARTSQKRRPSATRQGL
ncbi:MAG: hypothetical protein ACYC96_02710 [Fimbriimonadaceae bacterium]